ncbi:hypothetical protein [Endozoicomonas sp.]|uniref:hypothetical protein n=1 Tax=Endozoicomonas sp. TaxID=1892382 RepID=UPI00383AB710
MINKQLYLSVVTGLLVIGGFFSTTRASAVNPPPAHESVPLTRYWNIIADHLARHLIANGRLGSNTLYVDEKPAVSEISRYLEKQLSHSLKKSGAMVSAPASAHYAIELDVDINERSDGHGTAYTEGGDIDQLWMIREPEAIYSGQRVNYEMVSLSTNQPVNINLLADTDTEIILTARIMERGWIRLSQTYAFYFTAEDMKPEQELEHEKDLKSEEELESDEDMELRNHQRVFMDYQQKLDADIEQLFGSYGL